ncbi:MAG: DUF378 domain-containing protein [Verrucomicrobiales bacterium]
MITEHSAGTQLAFWLVVIGAINWGLVAMGFNLVDVLTGDLVWLERAIYALVGLSGLYLAVRSVMDRSRTAVGSRA